MARTRAESVFLVWSYRAGIGLSFIGIAASAAYLFTFLWMSPAPLVVENQSQLLGMTAERRLLLLSTGIFVGMSFGFLGFALCLIQAKGDIELEGSTQDYKLKVARLSPGLFVILCATVIIIICATFRIEYQVSRAAGSAGTPAEDAPPGGLPALRRSPPRQSGP